MACSRCCSSREASSGEQPIAFGFETAAALDQRGGRRSGPQAAPHASGKNQERQAERDVARPVRRVREPAERQRDGVARLQPGPLADDEGLILQRHVAMLGHLRRRELQRPELLRHHAELSERDRQLLRDREAPRLDRHRVPELHEGGSRRERSRDRHELAGDLRLRRRTLEHPTPTAATGSSNTIGAGGCTGSCAVLTISKRLKTFSASSPISITKRDRSPSTTRPARGVGPRQ